MARMPSIFSADSLAMLLTCGLLSASCINSSSSRGVGAPLTEPVFADFERGETTRADVLARLGPPSQVLSMEHETAFYYVMESIRSKGLILLLYNTHSEVAEYDRAVFFFDDDHVLTDYALTVHEE